ncbi:hypothetical protein ONZ45_g5891 [Pleurotus djamor]|nr:hypothetical protein ONZ45_g5891 [Pleurotus djamor]
MRTNQYIPHRPPSDVDVLEPLGLPLRGFQTNDETPTTAPTSLPTPSCERLQHVQVVPLPTWSLPTALDYDIKVPGAPLLRDYDSFTEGTAKGSFDSIPLVTTDECEEELIGVLDYEAVGSLPIDIGARSTIEQWRDTVYQSFDSDEHFSPEQYLLIPLTQSAYEDEECLVTPTKRPRSIASDDETPRRTRPRRHSMTGSVLADFHQSPVILDVSSLSLRQVDHPSRLRSLSAPPNNREPVPP